MFLPICTFDGMINTYVIFVLIDQLLLWFEFNRLQPQRIKHNSSLHAKNYRQTCFFKSSFAASVKSDESGRFFSHQCCQLDRYFHNKLNPNWMKIFSHVLHKCIITVNIDSITQTDSQKSWNFLKMTYCSTASNPTANFTNQCLNLRQNTSVKCHSSPLSIPWDKQWLSHGQSVSQSDRVFAKTL